LIIRSHLLGERPARPVPEHIAMVRGSTEWMVDAETWRSLAPRH